MTAPPEHLADRPAMPADLLSELLRTVRLSGERLVAYAPSPGSTVSFADVGALHIVEQGELVLRIEDGARIEHVRSGDAILLPRGDVHSVTDPGRRRHAASPGPGRWLCGTFTIGDPRASHLLASLPPVIILRATGGAALEGLEVARRMLLIEMESPSQGSAVMIARILDLLFIQILRAWAASADAEPNWLAGALDPQIGMALSAIHRNPGHNWTVEELARRCSLSRSAFAEKFLARVGTPPATYLTRVRLAAAVDMLRDTSLAVALVAENVGYSSEAAFSRAFSRRYGTPPARWRHDLRATRAQLAIRPE
jgi:AraC-like DNA-binding protein